MSLFYCRYENTKLRKAQALTTKSAGVRRIFMHALIRKLTRQENGSFAYISKIGIEIFALFCVLSETAVLKAYPEGEACVYEVQTRLGWQRERQ